MIPYPSAPSTIQDRLQWALRFGHNWNPQPQYANLRNLDEGRVAKMNGSEADAKLLIASWQEMDGNVELQVECRHGRALVPDGDVGPATEAVMAYRRCAMPDYVPPPGAQFSYGDPALQAAVESMQRAAAMTGTYWRECDPQRKGVHSLVIGIDATNAPSVFLQNQEHILAERVRIAAEIGVAVRFVINPQSMDWLQQYQVYRNIPGGVIGMNYFPSSNSCGRIPNGSMDSSYNPSNIRLHIGLGTHESEGHGFGFNHTRGGIMNASIIDSELTWKGDPAWSQVIRHYPGEPLEDMPGPGPGPDPKPPSQRLRIRSAPSGTFEVVALRDFEAKAGDVLSRQQFSPYQEV